MRGNFGIRLITALHNWSLSRRYHYYYHLATGSTSNQTTLTTTMVKARVFKVIKHFEGEAKESDFELIEEVLPALKDGEIQIEALYLSVDPYMRIYIQRYNYDLGSTMIGSQVGRVLESKNPKYQAGDLVVADIGWRSATNFNPDGKTFLPTFKLPDFKGLSPSLGIGALGMPGNTAYFGFLEICKPKAGETVVVSGAAGAVGCHVGQIAKIKGCRVIGIAGSAEKCEWLEKELGFDKTINYKTEVMGQALRAAAPAGIDCYFDNVGGEISTAVLKKMNLYGRVSVCGSIAAYNADVNNLPTAPSVQRYIINKQLRLEGFIVNRWESRWMEGIRENAHWIAQGKLKVKETITEGFENMPKAFIGMMRGENFGKAIVKA